MSVFARSDVMSVAIPSTSGGCGNQHSRPVVQGAPVRIWRLDCPLCEPVIRRDIESSTVEWTDRNGKKHRVNTSTWGDHELRIPQTPDEASVAADVEQEAQKGMAAALQGVAAQVMAKHQSDRVAQVDESLKADELRKAMERTSILEAELAQLRDLVNARNPTVAIQPVSEDPPLADWERKFLEEQVATVESTEIIGTCPSCGGPSVRKSHKGRTPRCENCRKGT